MGFVVLYIESSAFVFQVVYPACECPPRIPYARFGMGADLLIYHGYVSRPAPPRSLYAFVRRRISPSDHSPPGVPAVHLIEFVDHLLAGCKSSYIPAEKVLTSSLETLIGLRYSPPVMWVQHHGVVSAASPPHSSMVWMISATSFCLAAASSLRCFALHAVPNIPRIHLKPLSILS